MKKIGHIKVPQYKERERERQWRSLEYKKNKHMKDHEKNKDSHVSNSKGRKRDPIQQGVLITPKSIPHTCTILI